MGTGGVSGTPLVHILCYLYRASFGMFVLISWMLYNAYPDNSDYNSWRKRCVCVCVGGWWSGGSLEVKSIWNIHVPFASVSTLCYPWGKTEPFLKVPILGTLLLLLWTFQGLPKSNILYALKSTKASKVTFFFSSSGRQTRWCSWSWHGSTTDIKHCCQHGWKGQKIICKGQAAVWASLDGSYVLQACWPHCFRPYCRLHAAYNSAEGGKEQVGIKREGRFSSTLLQMEHHIGLSMHQEMIRGVPLT